MPLAGSKTPAHSPALASPMGLALSMAPALEQYLPQLLELGRPQPLYVTYFFFFPLSPGLADRIMKACTSDSSVPPVLVSLYVKMV